MKQDGRTEKKKMEILYAPYYRMRTIKIECHYQNTTESKTYENLMYTSDQNLFA